MVLLRSRFLLSVPRQGLGDFSRVSRVTPGPFRS